MSCDALFLPSTLYVSPENDSMVVGAKGSAHRQGHSTWVDVEYLSEGLCASSRPHFFRGVATVVTKLFNIVEPDAAFFGKKDYQQYKVISRLVRDLDFDIDIVGVPIQREEDGLAMSSRNALLSPDMRAVAPVIYQSLYHAKEMSTREGNISAETLVTEIRDKIQGNVVLFVNYTDDMVRLGIYCAEKGGVVDYITLVDKESLTPLDESRQGASLIAIAALFGQVRLLDNIEL